MSGKRKNHLRLLPPRVSIETVNELERLLAEARAGKLVGLAFVAICTSNYTVNAIGEANRRLTLTRGMVRVLDDLLHDRGRQGHPHP